MTISGTLSCKSITHLFVTALFLFAGTAQAAVLPPDIARDLEQRADTFVNAPGFEPLDVQAMLGDAWYARFDASSQSALRPDANLDPITRSMLLFASHEAPLQRARYRITYHLDSPGGDWYDVRRSYIEITRYNLAPGHHRQLVHDYGKRAASAGPAMQVPHVSWRLVTSPVMGMRAHVVAASRRVVDPYGASRATCLGLPCLALGTVEPDSNARFTAMPATDLPPADYRGWATPPQSTDPGWASPARIAQEMADHGLDGELKEPATLQKPELVMVIGLNSGGQDSNSHALMHLTSRMDDAIAETWIQRNAVPGATQWQRLDVPRQRRAR